VWPNNAPSPEEADKSRQAVSESGADVVWGDANVEVNSASKLHKKLNAKDYSPALVHLDLDVLDETIGKVNEHESAGGLTEDNLMGSMEMVPLDATPKSLTVCSFDPNLGDGDKSFRCCAIRDFTFEKWCFEKRIAVDISYGDQVSDKWQEGT
jgi:arginase family enzyme